MPRTTTTRETWADWLPDVEPTLTIDDVITRLQERGVDDVTVDNIRLWQHRRVLPAPIRRQVGTGKGGIRALYPPQAVDAIAEIRPLQREGVPLRQINAYLARMFGLNKGPISHPLSGHASGTSSATVELTVSDSSKLKTTESVSADHLDARAVFQTLDAHGKALPIAATVGSAPTTHTRTIPQSAAVSGDDPAFFEAMTEAAKNQEQRVGAPIREVEVTFTDTRGRKHSRVYILDTEIEH